MTPPIQMVVAGLISRHAIHILKDRDRNTYWTDTDTIEVKPVSDFDSLVSYFSTLAHEIGHWTGHPSRMDRVINRTPRHAPDYCVEKWREEMVAESFASLVLVSAGKEPRDAKWTLLGRIMPDGLNLAAEKDLAASEALRAWHKYANLPQSA